MNTESASPPQACLSVFEQACREERRAITREGLVAPLFVAADKLRQLFDPRHNNRPKRLPQAEVLVVLDFSQRERQRPENGATRNRDWSRPAPPPPDQAFRPPRGCRGLSPASSDSCEVNLFGPSDMSSTAPFRSIASFSVTDGRRFRSPPATAAAAAAAAVELPRSKRTAPPAGDSISLPPTAAAAGAGAAGAGAGVVGAVPAAVLSGSVPDAALRIFRVPAALAGGRFPG